MCFDDSVVVMLALGAYWQCKLTRFFAEAEDRGMCCMCRDVCPAACCPLVSPCFIVYSLCAVSPSKNDMI